MISEEQEQMLLRDLISKDNAEDKTKDQQYIEVAHKNIDRLVQYYNERIDVHESVDPQSPYFEGAFEVMNEQYTDLPDSLYVPNGARKEQKITDDEKEKAKKIVSDIIEGNYKDKQYEAIRDILYVDNYLDFDLSFLLIDVPIHDTQTKWPGQPSVVLYLASGGTQQSAKDGHVTNAIKEIYDLYTDEEVMEKVNSRGYNHRTREE